MSYLEYKNSGEEWIGKIPKSWKIEFIREFYNYRSEKVSDKIYPPLSVTKKGILPQLENAAKTDNNDSRKKVMKGDFVINSRSDRKGSCGVSPIDGSVSLIYHVLTPKDKTISKFSHYLFRSVMFAEEFYKWGHGIVDDLWSTKWEDMKKIKIPMPPKEERIIIVNYLDKKIKNMENQIDLNKKLLDLLEEKRTALINQVVTKGLNPEVPMKDSGIEWIGEIPEHWNMMKISNLFKYIGSGTTPKSSNEEYYTNGDVNWLITGDLNDNYIYETSTQISKDALRDISSLKIYPKNSLVIAMYGATIGKLGILKIETCTNQACCVLSNSAEMDVKYAFYWFLGYRKDVVSLSYGGGQPNISQDVIKNLRIIKPPLEEQKQIIIYLDKEINRINNTISKIKENIELLDEYKTSLIHHVVTGKIDVRGEEI